MTLFGVQASIIGAGDLIMVGVSIIGVGVSTMAGEILFGQEIVFGIHIIIIGAGIVVFTVLDGIIVTIDLTLIEVIPMEEEIIL